MDDTTSREKILKKVRNASINAAENLYTEVDTTSPIYPEMAETADISFAQAFTAISGNFVYCENTAEIISNLSELIKEKEWDHLYCFEKSLAALLTKGGVPFSSDETTILDAHVGITGCEYLIARLGSVMVSSRQGSGRRLFVYPEVHIVIASSSQLMPDLPEALTALREKYAVNMPSLVSLISGPSRTADIEKTLVMGAHGPKEIYVFFCEEELMPA
ncbi:MAG: lactate utilization protein [Bacteroidota bacterium]